MIIDLQFASGDVRIRTRSTPAIRHAVDLVPAVLDLSPDGSMTIHWRPSQRLEPMEFDAQDDARHAIEELLRWTTHFETEAGLRQLVCQVRRDAKLAQPDREAIIQRVAPALATWALATAQRANGLLVIDRRSPERLRAKGSRQSRHSPICFAVTTTVTATSG